MALRLPEARSHGLARALEAMTAYVFGLSWVTLAMNFGAPSLGNR
jgi:hypothetical protein